MKRFLSIPKNCGASRSRMKRGWIAAGEGRENAFEFIDDLSAICGSGRLGTSCHSGQIISPYRNEVCSSFGAKEGKTLHKTPRAPR